MADVHRSALGDQREFAKTGGRQEGCKFWTRRGFMELIKRPLETGVFPPGGAEYLERSVSERVRSDDRPCAACRAPGHPGWKRRIVSARHEERS